MAVAEALNPNKPKLMMIVKAYITLNLSTYIYRFQQEI